MLDEIIKEFNRLDQVISIESYQRQFDKLKCVMILILEPHFVSCFIGALS